MSTLAENVAKLSTTISAAYEVIGEKGGTLPEAKIASNLSAAIGSIPSGGGALQGYTLTITPSDGGGGENQHIIFASPDGNTEHQYVGDDLYRGGTVTKSNVVSYVWVKPLTYIFSYQGTKLTADTTIQGDWPCLAFGTKVLLADGTQKLVEDITYDDELAAWDFENGCMSSAKPIWICKPSVAPFSWRVIFKSGRVLDVVGPKGHRGFSKTKQTFAYLPECVGDIVASFDGDDEVASCEKVDKDVKYTNIITTGHFNMFTNGILTSCRLNNYRQFDAAQMKFSTAGWNYHDKTEFDDTPNAMIDGLHLCEQPSSTNELLKYVSRLAATMA